VQLVFGFKPEERVMWICFKKFCFWIPIYYQMPIIRIPDPGPGPGPNPYRGFMVDATILATVHEATKHIIDQTVREALQSGFAAGMKSMQARLGEDFSVSLEAPRQ
jgi:hypothetical protein